MGSRSIVSYDDITLPYDAPQSKPQPPSKKRRRNNNNNKKVPQHWDDPAPAEDEAMDGEESRELTQEEIWDDSALIDAWNAAMEEYEAFHGPDKGWKKEPVHKSPLWYNIPPKTLSKPTAGSRLPEETTNDESDSKPIDFDTFVPTHDPSLSIPAASAEADAQAAYTMPLTYLPNVSQDEAFEHAVQASYWSGYWTAVYHTLRQNQTDKAETETEQDGDDEDEDDEDFVSTQR